MRRNTLFPVALAFVSCVAIFQAQAPAPPAGGCAVKTGAQPRNASSGRHAYFETLIARPECLAAYSLRDQAQLDAIRTTGKGNAARQAAASSARKRTDKSGRKQTDISGTNQTDTSVEAQAGTSVRKQPIIYDPDVDAARVTIVARVTTDSQQKHLPVKVDAGSLLLTWDFRFDKNFAWAGKGYIARHKTWRLDFPEPWLSLKTDYQKAARAGRFAELYLSVNTKKWLGPGTTRGEREILFPRLTQFYLEPDTWTRAWLFVQDIDQSISHVSLWVADERHDVVQLYDRIAMVPPPNGFTTFRVEYDTSADHAQNPVEAHSWNRNIVALHNVPPSDIAALLERPVK